MYFKIYLLGKLAGFFLKTRFIIELMKRFKKRSSVTVEFGKVNDIVKTNDAFHQNENDYVSRVKVEQIEQITIEDTDHNHKHNHNHDHDHNHSHKNNSFIVLLSLSAHSFFDGLILGIQKSEKDMWQYLVRVFI